MRSASLAALFVLLPVGSVFAAEPKTNVTDAIAAFRDICLKTAPSFSGAVDAAKVYGIEVVDDSGSALKLGFNKDQSVGIQLKKNECVITTPPQSTRKLTKQFVAAIGDFLGTPVDKRLPSLITISGQPFVVFHNRVDGETFVLMKKQ